MPLADDELLEPLPLHDGDGEEAQHHAIGGFGVLKHRNPAKEVLVDVPRNNQSAAKNCLGYVARQASVDVLSLERGLVPGQRLLLRRSLAARLGIDPITQLLVNEPDLLVPDQIGRNEELPRAVPA